MRSRKNDRLGASVAFACLAVAVSGCAGFGFSPSLVESWSDPSFSLDAVGEISVVPVADVRSFDRGNAVGTAVAVRSAALSVLREKGYVAASLGPALLIGPEAGSIDTVLEPPAVAARSAPTGGIVLAIAMETTEPDILVAPATMRVGLRAVIVDVSNNRVVWGARSVAESGFLLESAVVSSAATTYGSVYQSVRALLSEVGPARERLGASE